MYWRDRLSPTVSPNYRGSILWEPAVPSISGRKGGLRGASSRAFRRWALDLVHPPGDLLNRMSTTASNSKPCRYATVAARITPSRSGIHRPVRESPPGGRLSLFRTTRTHPARIEKQVLPSDCPYSYAHYTVCQISQGNRRTSVLRLRQYPLIDCQVAIHHGVHAEFGLH